jgi:hypothetical protein
MAGADPALIVRVGANLDDLKAGLTASDGLVIAWAETLGDLMGDAIKFVVGELTDLAKALPEVVLHGSEVADVGDNFAHLAEQAGHLSTALLTTLRDGTHGTIDDFQLMQRANKDLAAGLKLTDDQFGVLAKGAFALSQATGIDTTQALDAMSDAMVTGRARAVELLTGKVDLTAAEETYAARLHKTAADLDVEEKLEADRVAILQAVGGAVAKLGEQTDGLDEKVAQAKVSWTNFLDELGRTIATSPVLIEAFDGIRDILIEAFGGSSTELVRTMKTAIEDMIVTLASWGSTAVDVVAAAMEGWHALLVVYNSVLIGLEHLESGLLKTNLAALQVKAFLEPWNDFSKGIKDVQNHIDEVQASIKENQAAVEQHEAAEGKWAIRGAELSQKFSDLALKLAHTRDETQNFVGPINQAATGTERLGDTADEATPKVKKLTAAEKELASIVAEMDKTTFALAMAHEKQWRDEQLSNAKRVNDAVLTELHAREQLNASYGLTVDGTIKVTSAAETYRIALDKLHTEKQEGISQAAQEQLLIDAYTKSLYDEATATDKVTESLKKVPPPTDDAEKSVKAWSETLVLGVKNLDELNAALTDFYDSFAGSNVGTPGVGSYGTPQFMSMGGYRMPGSGGLAQRAGGGPVSGGTPYMVGELGPELFVPPSGGAIVPHGGAVVNNYYITQPLGTPQAIAAAVGTAQMTAAKGRGERFRPIGV